MGSLMQLRFFLLEQTHLLYNFIKKYRLMSMLVLFFASILVMEVKHKYHIDIYPAIDFPLDNLYFWCKDQFGI